MQLGIFWEGIIDGSGYLSDIRCGSSCDEGIDVGRVAENSPDFFVFYVFGKLGPI